MNLVGLYKQQVTARIELFRQSLFYDAYFVEISFWAMLWINFYDNISLKVIIINLLVLKVFKKPNLLS